MKNQNKEESNNDDDGVLVDGFVFSENPNIFITSLKGKWLIERCTMSWRIDKPKKGFQRKLNERRLIAISKAVLENHRPFPNAIILACDNIPYSEKGGGKFIMDTSSKFLIIDGQHRLYSQEFSEFDADFACMIHTGIDEQEMAYLFKEINDTQKRVPSSLRWDLIRLIEEDTDLPERKAVDIIYDLVMVDRDSPIYQRVDLTGEVPSLKLKQGSLAPEIRQLLKSKGPFKNFEEYEIQKSIIKTYLIALRDFDLSGWKDETNIFLKNRILRVAFQCLNKLIEEIDNEDLIYNPIHFSKFINEIDKENYAKEKIVGLQGGAGMSEIKKQMIKEMGI